MRTPFRGAQPVPLRRWYERLARGRPRLRRLIPLACAMLIVFSTFAVVANTTSASYTNVLANGSFEGGFQNQPGCGMVGSGWGCFTNGGAANYGFYDDQWDAVVADGEHSQLIEINTKGMMAPDADRYAGIYQTVRVVDWANYTLNLRGMIRTTALDGDPWRYRVQVGWSSGPHADWSRVSNWVDVGWDKYYERTAPGALLDFSTGLMAEGSHVTVYIRAWKKWGVPEEEIDINLDAISLTGPAPYGHDWKPMPDHAKPEYGKPYVPAEPPVYHKPPPEYHHGPPADGFKPGPGPIYPGKPVDSGTCAGPELIYNGGFEQGFIPVAVGHVGRGWGAFTNGGAANYGFYDEQWPPVVAEGKHGQLIEINSKGIYPSDPDRYAGIYQRISHLHPGASYELTVRGLLRGAGNEDDPYRFAAQWGYNSGANTEWSHVSNWQEMDLGKIYPRTEPGALGTFRVRFTAPAHEIVLFIRGWKKWGISEVEMDFNLDAISLRACGGTSGPIYPHPQPKPWPVVDRPVYPVYPPKPLPPPVCEVVVQPGDTLSWIAEANGVSTRALMEANGIYDPNFIFVGQRLILPGCGGPEPVYEPPCCEEPPPSPCCDEPAGHPGPYVPRTHVVQPGETFSIICSMYGTDPYALAEINGITNWDLIYVGQVLTIP